MAITQNQDRNKESAEQVGKIIESGDSYRGTMYHPGYIDAVFTVWYTSGKPSPKRLVSMLPDPSEFGIAIGFPSEQTIRLWVTERFQERAEYLDDEVNRQLSDRLVAEKVKMLESHSKIAGDMISKATEILSNPDTKINANTALRMLIEGIRVERESKGIPRTLEMLADKEDYDLVEQIEDILSRADSTLVLPEGSEE